MIRALLILIYGLVLMSILTGHPKAQGFRECPKDKLSLQECIRISLANSLKAEMGRERVSGAREGIREAQAAYWPKISLTTKVVWEEEKSNFCPGHLQARWGIFDGGKRASLLKKAEEDYLSSGEQKRLVSQEIIHRTADAYIRRLHAEEAYLLAKEVLAREERRLEAVRAKSQKGLVPQLDVVSVKVEIYQSQLILTQAFSDLAIKRFSLNYTLGFDIDKVVEIEEINYPRWQALIDKYGKMEDVFKRALSNRVDYKIAGSKLRAEEANLKGVRAEAGPNIFLETNYYLSPQSKEENGDFSIGLILDIPFFEGGLRKSRIERAKVQVRMARLEKENLKRRIYKRIAEAREKLKNLQKELHLREEKLPLLFQNLEAQQSLYGAGISDINKLNAAHRDYVCGRIKLSQTRSDILSAFLCLLREMGEIEVIAGTCLQGHP